MKSANHSEKVSNIRTRASDSATSESTVASDAKDSSVELLPQGVTDVTSIAKSSTGPRTLQGKERSKHNALKHGIFSSVVVLKDESREEFDSLLSGFWEFCQPEGKMEEIHVEKLAMIVWRLRRVVIAEGAEIRMGTEFLEWDRDKEMREESNGPGALTPLSSESILMDQVENPLVLNRCLDLLTKLKEGIEKNGFSHDHDEPILSALYGCSVGDLPFVNLQQIYKMCRNTAGVSEEERLVENYANPKKCRRIFLERINLEIRHLQHFGRKHVRNAKKRLQIEKLRQHIPASPCADRLLRYEASLERAFDRTLNQLERIQRMRKGQIVPPPLNVQVNS
jgi:hypothetical protein